MKILVLDPGLSKRLGHNAAIAEEFSLELGDRKDVEITYAGAATLVPKDFADLAGNFLPVFCLDGYCTFSLADVSDQTKWTAIQALLLRQMQSLRPDRFDLILMPTVYPLHLQALAACGESLRRVRILCGLLLPARFWAREAGVEGAVARMLGSSIAALRAVTDAQFYTETGRYAFEGGALATPSLLIPVSAATLATMETLAAAPPKARAGLTFGYFGQPFTSKGFALLAMAVERGLPEGVRVVLRLPPGHDAKCAAFNAFAPQVDASSRPMSNADFLREMAAVDVVFAHYDPAHYRDKMSGIVPEAICLGKAVLLSTECLALVEFLDRHAPGSFACAGYDIGSLRSALSLSPELWRELGRRAAASAPVVRAMKSAARYLTIAGAGALYPRPQESLDRTRHPGATVSQRPAILSKDSNQPLVLQ